MSLNVSFALVEVTGDCVIWSIDISIESGDTTTGGSVCNVATGIISIDGVLSVTRGGSVSNVALADSILSFTTGGSICNVSNGVSFTDGTLSVGMDTSDLGSDKYSLSDKIDRS